MKAVPLFVLAVYLLASVCPASAATCPSGILPLAERIFAHRPKGSVRELKVVHSEDSKNAFSDSSTWSSGFSELIGNIKHYAQDLRAKNVGTKSKMVFYPAAGHDSSTPLQLFPDAQTVVAIDLYSFHTRSSPELKLGLGDQFQNFLDGGQNQTAESQAENIVARLMAVVPNFRLRKIVEFKTPVSYDKFWRHLEVSEKTHGIVEYDTGEGTPVRYYVHIQDIYNDQHEADNRWWLEEILKEVDVILVKAPMSFAEGIPSSARKLFKSLKEKRGLLFTDSYTLSSFAAAIGENGGRIEDSPKKDRRPFGYMDAVLVRF